MSFWSELSWKRDEQIRLRRIFGEDDRFVEFEWLVVNLSFEIKYLNESEC